MSKRRSRSRGRDADLYFGDAKQARQRNKDAQLCAQIREALSLALAGAADEELEGLWVAEVVPAPHVGHLRVEVRAPSGADLARLSAKLEEHSGQLRYEAAGAIHRKKVPSLTFVVLPDVEPDDAIE